MTPSAAVVDHLWGEHGDAGVPMLLAVPGEEAIA